jgi:hypothetical protein
MKRSASVTWAGAFLFLLAPFATPLHLAIEEHEWHHEESGESHRHDSEQESHPASDHELTAVAKAPRLVLAPVEIVLLHVSVVPPDIRTWFPTVEADAHSPPDAHPTPPQSPRAPPV